MNPTPKLHPAVAALITIVLVGTATGVVVAVNNQSKTAETNSSASNNLPAADASNTTSANSDSSSSNDTTMIASYKDGQYTATTNYRTPGGSEQIAVTITVANNTISTVGITQQGDSRESEEYQSMFASAYKSQVVGKKINEVNLSRVAGASLTSIGFNDALEQIKQDAAA